MINSVTPGDLVPPLLVRKLTRLVRAVHASSDDCASVSIHAWPDMIQVSLGAEDPEDDLPFIQAEDFLVVLDEAIVRAEVALAPSYECTWSEDFTGARGALNVLERDRTRGADYDLAFIPRSPVTGGDAWELQAGEGEVTIFVAPSLVAVVAEYVAEVGNTPGHRA